MIILQDHVMEQLFLWLGEQASTGEDGPNQQVGSFAGASVNVCRAAITQ